MEGTTVDNPAWPFNLLIYKDSVGNPCQIVRQMVYILRWASKNE